MIAPVDLRLEMRSEAMTSAIRRACGRGGRGVAAFAVVSLLAAALDGTTASATSTLQVCRTGCEYASIGTAVAAAKSGDTVAVGSGTYKGGFNIDKDLILVGAGAGVTQIRGGGPVITVGAYHDATQPTVEINGVTITGGLTRSSFGDTYQAVGGGIWVPPAANDAIGATLIVDRSVISGNRAAPSTSVDSGISCPGGDCPFAQAGGGGIDSWGTVTLEHSYVLDNVVSGAVTSDADGAGIYVQGGGLTLVHSVVANNRASVTLPNGRFAEGGGIMVDATFSPPGKCCTLVVSNSEVDDNSAILRSTLPSRSGGALLQIGATAGGIYVGDNILTTIEDSTVRANYVAANDPNGEPIGVDAGISVGDSSVVIDGAVISGNRSTTTSATSTGVGSSGTAIELDGPGLISNSRIVGNVSTSTSADGAAATNGGLAVLNFNGDPKLVTVQDSVISGNVAEAFSAKGSASVQGSGVLNDSLLLLRHVQVAGNIGRAQGPTGVAQGAGIWNGVDLSGPPVRLTLDQTSVTGNVLVGGRGIRRRGAGLYTTLPVSLSQVRINQNRPDQCAGCAAGS
jgi:hypothetical protein